ncbi:MAG: hypothetical protein WBP79_14645 [Candidatus Acidiferrales bacterium]
MKTWLSRLGLAVVSVTLFAFSAAVMAPRAARAVVSTIVTVANTAANPVPNSDVDNGARQPFQQQFSIGVPDGSNEGFQDSITVPAGKRLVVEFVSGEIFLPTNQQPRIEICTLANSGFTDHATHHILATLQQPISFLPATGNDTSTWVFSQSTEIYADPGTSLTMEVLKNSNSGAASFFLTISGHFVNLP